MALVLVLVLTVWLVWVAVVGNVVLVMVLVLVMLVCVVGGCGVGRVGGVGVGGIDVGGNESRWGAPTTRTDLCVRRLNPCQRTSPLIQHDKVTVSESIQNKSRRGKKGPVSSRDKKAFEGKNRSGEEERKGGRRQ